MRAQCCMIRRQLMAEFVALNVGDGSKITPSSRGGIIIARSSSRSIMIATTGMPHILVSSHQNLQQTRMHADGRALLCPCIHARRRELRLCFGLWDSCEKRVSDCSSRSANWLRPDMLSQSRSSFLAPTTFPLGQQARHWKKNG